MTPSDYNSLVKYAGLGRLTKSGLNKLVSILQRARNSISNNIDKGIEAFVVPERNRKIEETLAAMYNTQDAYKKEIAELLKKIHPDNL